MGGGSCQLTSADFKVTATLDNNTTKVLPLKTDTADGYTFSSSVTASDIKGDNVQVGNYTLTFGYGELESKTINYKVEKATFDTSVLTWTSEMKYNSNSQAPKITNLSDYNDVVAVIYGENNSKKDVSKTDEYYTATATLVLADTRNYNALTTEQKSLEHNWTMQKGDNPFGNLTVDSITFGELTYNGTPNTGASDQTPTLSGYDIGRFKVELKEIDGDATSKTSAKDAGTYKVKVEISYIGEDAESYNSTATISGERTWTISPLDIDTSSVVLKGYSSAFTYNGDEQSVAFDLSSLISDGYISGEDDSKAARIGSGSDGVVLPEGGLPSPATNDLLIIKGSSSLKATNAGTYSATITFEINTQFGDYENYRLSNATVTKVWKINPKTVKVTAPTIAAKTFVYGVSADDVKASASVAGKATLNLSDFLSGDGGTAETKSELYTTLQNSVRFKICQTGSASAQGVKGKLNAGEYYLVPVVTDAKSGNYVVVVEDDSITSFEVAKKELNGSLNRKEVEYSKPIKYTKNDFELSGFVNDDTIEDITITGYDIKYKSNASDSGWSSDAPAAIGTYQVKLENIEEKNYTIVVSEGQLTVNKCNISLSAEDVSWSVGSVIVPNYNETDKVWEITIEESDSALSYAIAIKKLDSILKKEYTNNEGGTLGEIKAAGTYYIKANLSLESSSESNYEFTGASFTLKITITKNPFKTTESGESSISVTVKTPAEDGAGEPSEEGLTFNEFANQTKFNYGDSVSFTLANDPAAAADEGDSDVEPLYSAGSDSDNFKGYKVMYNGEQIIPVKGVYTINFVSTTVGTGLVIKKIANDDGEDEIFAKSNFKVTRTVKQALSTVWINGIEYVNWSCEKWGGYYKLSKNQTSITVTIDESLVGMGLCATISGNGSEFNFDTSNSVTIPINSSIASGGDLVLSIMNGMEAIFQTHIYSWVEVKDIYVCSEGLDGRKVKKDPCSGMSIVGAVGVSWNEYNSFITDIGVTFENGYGNDEGWTFVVTDKNGTLADYTKTVNGKKEIIYVINIYHNNEFQYSISVYCRYDFYVTNFDSDRYVYDNTFSAETLTSEVSNNITSKKSLIKKSGTNDAFGESVTLTEELTSVDWKIEFVISEKTYTFIKKLVIVKQDSTFDRNFIKQEIDNTENGPMGDGGSNNQGIEGAENDSIGGGDSSNQEINNTEEDLSNQEIEDAENDSMGDEESNNQENNKIEKDGILTSNGKNFEISGNKIKIIRGNDYNYSSALTVDEFIENCFDASAKDKGASKWSLCLNDSYEDKVTITKQEYLFKNGLVFLKFTLSEKTDNDSTKTSFIILNVNIDDLFDDDVDATFEILDTSTFTESVITPTDDVFNLTTGNQLMVKPSNWNVTISIKDANGLEISDDEEFVLTTAGVYTLTITSVDCSNSKTYVLVVTGEYIPMLGFSLKTENGEDKTLLYDEDAGSGEAKADFKMGYETVNNGYKFFTYLGNNHGLKITTVGTKRYLTLTSFSSIVFSGDSLYTLDGEQFVIGTNGFNLEILSDENASPYVAFYSFMETGEYNIQYYFYVYLCDEIFDWELTFEGETSGDVSSAQDKKLILELENAIYSPDVVTDESDLEIKTSYSYCLFGFVGKENHGIKIYNDDDIGKYITLKSWVSGTGVCDGIYGLDENEEPVQITGQLNLILELLPDLDDEIYATSFYTKMFVDTYEYVMVYIFFCDEADIPEDYFNQGGDYPPDYDPDGDHSYPDGYEEPNTLTPIVTLQAVDFSIILNKVTEPNGNEYYMSNNSQILNAGLDGEDGNLVSWDITLTIDQNKYSALSKDNATYTLENIVIDSSLYATGTLTFKDYYEEWKNNTSYEGQTITESTSLSNINLKVITEGSDNLYVAFTLKNEGVIPKIACMIRFIVSESNIGEITE